MLDDTVRLFFSLKDFHINFYRQGDRFNAFGSALKQTSQRAARAFGIGEGNLRTGRIALFLVFLFIGFWVTGKVWSWWRSGPAVP
jgi:hypothetical protein